MSNKAFSLVSGSCKLATRCSIFNAWLFDEDVLFELLVCCCVCAACAAIIIARTNRPIDWKLVLSLRSLFEYVLNKYRLKTFSVGIFPSKEKTRITAKEKESFCVVLCALSRRSKCSSLFRKYE